MNTDDMTHYRINDRMFYGCKSLQSIRIPDSITAIGNEAFSQCTSLAEASLSEVQHVGKCAFYNTQISEVDMQNHLTRLEECALSGPPRLLSIQLNQHDFNAFASNALSGSSLTSITFSSIDSSEVI